MSANLNRAQVIDANFSHYLHTGQLPAVRPLVKKDPPNLSQTDLLDLFDSQLISRHLDLQSRILKDSNQSYYTIGSSGHEGNAAIAKAFRHTDMAFLHYRSCAFIIQRAKHINQPNSIEEQLLAFVASSDDPIAAGRHKVFGSVPLYVPPQTSTIASHLPKAVGAALSITRAKELNIEATLPNDSVILVSFGDASLNHSSTQGALNAAQWIVHNGYPLPLVFICEDNGLGISVPTPEHWVETTMAKRAGIHYIAADGLHVGDMLQAAQEAEYIARQQHKPVFLHMRTVRLLGHAGSDIESAYRNQAAIEAAEHNDPLLHSARLILEAGYLSTEAIIARYEQVREQVAEVASTVMKRPKLASAKAVMASIVPKPNTRFTNKTVTESTRQQVFAESYEQLTKPRNMCQLINYALTDIMLQYENTLVFGEDVGKKGGVYRVTADLQQRFGQRRVFDTLLDEQTILGTAIGMAHNGFLPIPEIQFLAYLHNAEDQLRGEASTLSFFSSGQYANPMVVRIASLAYQKGFGGHFHNDNSIAVLRDLPGVIIACPSNGADAASMLRRCVRIAAQENRIVVFLEPIALYMTKDLHSPGDNLWLSQYPSLDADIDLGELGIYGDSEQIVILTYGNGYYLSRQAEKIIHDRHGLNVKIIDLRWLAPLNTEAILKEVSGIEHILIVDEGRRTGSISEALITLLVEGGIKPTSMQRIVGEDSFIPLGEAWRYVLPSCDDIVASIEAVLVL